MSYKFLSTILGIDANFTGNLGVGTTTPTNRLDVIGTSYFSTDMYVGQNHGIFFNGNGGYAMGLFSSGSDLLFQGGSVERMRLTSAGQLSIGTTANYGAKLQVYSDSNIQTFVSPNASAYVSFVANNSTTYGYIGTSYSLIGGGIDFSIRSENNLLFATSGANERMRISTSGNVLINTLTDAGYKLDVNGISIFRDELLITNSFDSRLKSKILNNNAGSNARAEYVVNAYGNSWGIGMGSAANNSNKFYINEDSNGSDVTRFTIATGGNVGIGTTNPGAMLDIYHPTNGYASVGLQGYSGATKWFLTSGISGVTIQDFAIGNNNNGTSPKLVITSASNVLIGTTTDAGYKLDVNGTGRFSNTLYANSNIVFSGFIQPSSNVGYGVKSANGAVLQEWYNGSTYNYGTFVNSGNINAGNTSSGAQINVYASSYGNNGLFNAYGTDNAIKLQMGALGTNEGFFYTGAGNKLSFYSGGSTTLTLASNNNVGIGTTSPSQKLEVAGYALFQSGIVGLNDLRMYGDNSSSSGIILKTNGNLLIGTTTDSGYKLDVNGTGIFRNDLTATASSTVSIIARETGGAEIRLYQQATDSYIISSNSLRVYVNGAERFQISGSGATSIFNLAGSGTRMVVADSAGTLSTQSIPTGTVTGSGTTNYIPKFTGSTAIGNSIAYDNGTSLAIGTPTNFAGEKLTLQLSSSSSISTVPAVARFINSGNSNITKLILTDNNVADATISLVPAGLGNSLLSFGIQGATVNYQILNIKETGNVGIGETNPQAKLHIASNSLGFTQYDYSPAQNIFTYTGNSEVLEFGALRTTNGSDWTSDGFRIQEKVDSTWMGYMQFNGDGNNAGISFGTGASAASRQSISERMRITSSGNVLIGTTTDAGYRLDVIGQSRVQTSTYGLSTTPFLLSQLSGDARSASLFLGDPSVYNPAAATNTVNGSIAGISLNFYADNWKMSATRSGGADIYGLVFSRNGSEKLVITSTGNVAIGLTDAAYKTTIYNSTTDTDVLCLSNPQINPDLTQHFVGLSFQDQNANGSGNVSAIRSYSNLYSYWGSILTFSTTSSVSANTLLERMRILYNGNVGIGTTIPSNRLHVVSQEYTTVKIENNLSSNFLTISNTNGSYSASVFSIINDLAFATSNSATEHMRITNAGNLLIGTTTDAGYKLDVNGTGRFSGGIVSERTVDALSGLFLRSNINGTSIVNNGIILGKSTSGNDAASIVYTHISNGSTSNRLGFGFWGSDNLLNLTAAGNVGIGTTSPTNTLDVNGSVRIRNNNAILFDTTGAGTSNYVGITNNYWTTITCGRGYSSQIDLTNSNGILFSTNYSERMRIEVSGNVLIGTTTDNGAKLQVNGFSYFGSDMFTFQNGGIFFSGNTSYSAGIYARNFGSDLWLQSGSVPTLKLASSGTATIPNLGGGGVQMVVTDNNGTLSTAAIPTPTTKSFGAFQEDTTQTAAVSNVGYGIKFTVPDISGHGVDVVGDPFGDRTYILFSNSGFYNIQFSCQFQNTDSQLHDVSIWLRKNGNTTADDVPSTAGFVSVPNKHGGVPGHCIVAWNYFVEAASGDFFQLAWSTTDHTNVTMEYYPAGSPPPSAASAILTVNQVN